MSLRSRGSRQPVRVGNFGKNGAISVPIRTTSPYPEKELEFENAVATPANEIDIASGVNEATLSPLQVSDHPTMATGVIVPIFLGKPGNPTQEFIYSNPYVFDSKDFYPEELKDCAKVFLFANVVTARRSSGFKTNSPTVERVPYGPTPPRLPNDTAKTHQVVFVDQDIFDDKFITVNGLNLMMKTAGNGVPVLHSEDLKIDTWYNGKFNQYNIGNNVGIGYTNDKKQSWDLGDRYTWSFGTIWFSYNLSTRIDRNIDGTFKNCNVRSYSIDGNEYYPQASLPEDVKEGMQIKAEYTEDIKLIAWKFPMDNVRGPLDIYNPDNIITWETEIIPVGDEKWKIHLPNEVMSEYTSGAMYVGEVSGALYNEYYKEHDFFVDHPDFKDIGWYSRTTTTYYGKIYGKALYTHMLKKLSPGKCTFLKTNSLGNIVIDFDDTGKCGACCCPEGL